jgi:hypothetical protein
MSRIEELRQFVETSGRGETLKVPHDTARELLAEIDVALANERRYIRERVGAAESRIMSLDVIGDTGFRATVSTRHP